MDMLIYIMFWCNFDQHLSYLQEPPLRYQQTSFPLHGRQSGSWRWGFSILRQPHSSLFKMPSSVAEDCGVTWEHTDQKGKFFCQPQKETYSFQQQKVRSLLSLVYFKDHLHIETLVLFFLLHQFGDDCETQWLPAPNFPPTKTRVQDECSGVGA